MSERLETTRLVPAPASDIFALLCDPQGQVAIDASGMLQDWGRYDWSQSRQDFKDDGVFPVISEANLRATLGILDRTVRRGYPSGSAGA